MSNEITKKIRESGQSVNAWARENGFKPLYVSQVINGHSKSQIGVGGAIKAALKRDGFWVE